MTTPQTIIGSHDQKDWSLRPTQPPSDLQQSAPDLWNRLHEERILGPARRYEEADAEAGAAQNRFKTATRRASKAVLSATILGAAISAEGVLDSRLGSAGSFIVVTCGVLGALAGALGAMWLARIKQGDLLAAWMTARAKAETARIEYFDRVGTVCQGDAPRLAQLQLEYFRRYQLEVQLAYYLGRGRQHREAHRTTIVSSTLAIAVAGTLNATAGILSVKSILFSALGSLGVVATSLSAYLTTAGATSQDGRNAERYARTRDTLSHIQDRLDEVRAALAFGQREALAVFVKAVNDEISLEHRQWLDEKNRYAGAVQDLEQKLATLQKARGEDPSR